MRRQQNRHVAFNDGLAGQRVATLDIFGRQPQGAATADVAVSHLHQAAAAAPLPTTRLADFNTRQPGRFSQQRTGLDVDRIGLGAWLRFVQVKGNGMIGHE